MKSFNFLLSLIGRNYERAVIVEQFTLALTNPSVTDKNDSGSL